MANSNGWGDGAANNSIGWGQGANNAIAWGDSHAKSWAGATDIVGLTTDPAASAYFASTGITGATEQTAIDNLVKGLKSDGLWSKMKAVYPFVTDNRNLISYSEDFSNGVWSPTFCSISTNTTTAPNGTLTADTLTGNGSTEAKVIRQTISTYGSGRTLSIYAKKNTNDFVQIVCNGNTNDWANFDINNGVTGSKGPLTGVTTITNVGNGWYRCTMVTGDSSSSNFNIYLISSITSPRGEINTLSTSVFLWGAQLEQGSTATTYQPIATTQQAFISNQFKYNLVNPVDSDAAFRLVFNGGWTHSANGATPNGTNGYADTKFNPSLFTANHSTHLSYYSRTNSNGATLSTAVDIGVSGSAASAYLPIIYFRSRSNNLFDVGFYSYNAPTNFNTANTNSTGLYIGNRTSNVVANSWKNGIKQATKTNTETQNITTLTKNVFLSALNLDGTAAQFVDRQCAFSSIGDGLTDTEAANLYTRVQAFQTELSRQV